MSRLFTHKANKMGEGIARTLDDRFKEVDAGDVDASLFAPASFDAQAGERAGYSNYSYWRSTFKVFLSRRVSIFFLGLLGALLLFTLVQPMLPGQKLPTKIHNYDDTSKQIRNQKPYLDNVLAKLPQGTQITLSSAGKTWASVHNTLQPLKRNDEVDILSSAGDFSFVRATGGQEGWVQSSFLRAGNEGQARVFMPTTLNVYPSVAVYAAMADIEMAVHEQGAATWQAVTTRDAALRTSQTDLAFWFGTNAIGQDLWSRIWSGTRTSLMIGVTVGLICSLIGILMGAIWGYVRRLDRLFTEMYNVLENIPSTVLRILITYILRPSLPTIIFVMCITGWLGMARFVRNQIVIIRDREYNLASRCLGTTMPRMIYRNLLPYLISVIMLRTALAIPDAIGTEVFLTYIGLGLPVSLPSLGNLINEGRLVMTDPALIYQIIFPAVTVSVITISFYALGNAFSDAADPRNHV